MPISKLKFVLIFLCWYWVSSRNSSSWPWVTENFNYSAKWIYVFTTGMCGILSLFLSWYIAQISHTWSFDFLIITCNQYSINPDHYPNQMVRRVPGQDQMVPAKTLSDHIPFHLTCLTKFLLFDHVVVYWANVKSYTNVPCWLAAWHSTFLDTPIKVWAHVQHTLPPSEEQACWIPRFCSHCLWVFVPLSCSLSLPISFTHPPSVSKSPSQVSTHEYIHLWTQAGTYGTQEWVLKQLGIHVWFKVGNSTAELSTGQLGELYQSGEWVKNCHLICVTLDYWSI